MIQVNTVYNLKSHWNELLMLVGFFFFTSTFCIKSEKKIEEYSVYFISQQLLVKLWFHPSSIYLIHLRPHGFN